MKKAIHYTLSQLRSNVGVYFCHKTIKDQLSDLNCTNTFYWCSSSHIDNEDVSCSRFSGNHRRIGKMSAYQKTL